MKVTFITTSIFAMLALTACGSSSTIDLQKQPEKPAQQTPPSGKPGGPANPDDPAQNPEKPELPDPGSLAPRYRLICELGANGAQIATFATAETSTRSIDPVLNLFIGKPLDPNQDVTRGNYNVIQSHNPVALASSAVDHADLLFTGVTIQDPKNVRLLFSSVDTVLRLGKAVDLGAAVVTTKETRQAADLAGLASPNYGASDAGRFLILPTSGGFKITTRDRSRVVGQLSGDSSKTILPQIFESKNLFTALVYNGRGFTPVVRKLSISNSSVSVVRSLDVGSVAGSAASIQTFDSSKLIWAEENIAGSTSLVLAVLDSTSGRVTRTTYRTQISGARIYPQIAVSRDDSGTLVNVAVESVSSNPTASNPGAKVTYAKLQTLSFNGSTLVEGQAIDYPDFAIAKVENTGLKGKWIINSLLTNNISDRTVATFDSTNGYQAYIVSGGLFGAIGNVECLHPQMTEVTQ